MAAEKEKPKKYEDYFERFQSSFINYRLQAGFTFLIGLVLLIITIFLRSDYAEATFRSEIRSEFSVVEAEVTRIIEQHSSNGPFPDNQLEQRLISEMTKLRTSMDALEDRLTQEDDPLFYFMAIISSIMMLGAVVPGYLMRAKYGHEFLEKLDAADKRRFEKPGPSENGKAEPSNAEGASNQPNTE